MIERETGEGDRERIGGLPFRVNGFIELAKGSPTLPAGKQRKLHQQLYFSVSLQRFQAFCLL